MLIIMSVLGAVVMPHNLFLHSEVIQSHEYNKQDESSIRKVLKYEFYDTLFSMIVGWAINSAMILLAAATFFRTRTPVEELQQAKSLLDPLLGSHAGIIFALALLMAGISSTITSGMAAGSIFAGIFGESYHIKDIHSKVGILISLGIALVLIFFIENPFTDLSFSDDSEYPAAFHGVPASRTDLFQTGDGQICQLPVEFIRALYHCGDCLRIEYHAVAQLNNVRICPCANCHAGP